MTRALDEVQGCLELRRRGLNATEIARHTGIPRATVRDWIHGRVSTARRHDFRGCDGCGQAAHAWEQLPVEYVYLLGIYLGDGCISPCARGVFKLRVTLDKRYPGILSEVEEAMHTVLPRNRVGRVPKTGCIELCSYSRAWPCLFPQHGPGRKHHRRIRLTEWQWGLVERQPELFLRGLIHSDGHRFENTGRGNWRHPRYGFTNFSLDIRSLFFDACDLLDLHATWSRPNTIYVSRKADVARMDEFVGPKA
jgi:hypothetical protein